MRIATGGLLCALLFSASSHAATVYVPVVYADARPIPSQMFPSQSAFWKSTLTVSNLGATQLTLRYTGFFGGASVPPFDGCTGSTFVNPDSWNFACFDSPFWRGVGFVQMDLDPGLVATAAIQLDAFRAYTPNGHPVPPYPYGDWVPMASAPLPVYDSLFPASSVVTSAEIVEMPPPLYNRDINDPLVQRRNVTIFNGSQETATATIRAVGSATPPIVVTLQGEEVTQVNDVFPESDYRVLVVTVSQPFLCYASSVITYADPTIAPAVAVYSFHQVQ